MIRYDNESLSLNANNSEFRQSTEKRDTICERIRQDKGARKILRVGSKVPNTVRP